MKAAAAGNVILNVGLVLSLVVTTTIVLAVRKELKTKEMSWLRKTLVGSLLGWRGVSTSTGLPPAGLRGKVPLFNGPMHLKIPLSETKDKRLIIVGDVHGCFDELERLLDKVQYSQDSGDALCFVGDLVGKGPKPAEVVDFVRKSGAYCVRGNHDHRVIEYFYDQAGYFKDSGPSEHRAMAENMFNEEEMDWMRTLPLSYLFEEHNLYVVHAGISPGTNVEDMKPRMLMNMRKIAKDGKPKTGGEGTPWAELWNSETKVVFGHDAVQGFKVFPNAIGLDSGCVYGKELTSYILPGNEFVSVPALKTHCDPFANKKK